MRPLRWVMVLAVSVWGVGCQPARSASPELPVPSTQSLAIEPATQPATQPVDPPVVQPVVTEPADGGAAEPAVEPEDVPATQPTTEPALDDEGDGQADAPPATTQVSAAPSTEPATTQAATTTTAPVVESPKAALAGVLNATVRGDVEGVRTRLFVEGDEAGRMAAAMIEVAEAAKRVRDASAEKFGWDNLKVLDIEIVPPLLLAGATEQVEGDRATVQFPGQGAGMVMRQVNGGWKLSVPELVEVQKRTREIDQVIDDARDPAERLNALAERVKAGEFQSIEQVHLALAQSLFAAGETVKKQ